jgi:hypothetical protein
MHAGPRPDFPDSWITGPWSNNLEIEFGSTFASWHVMALRLKGGPAGIGPYTVGPDTRILR